MANDTKTDQAILKGGSGTPLVYGDFTLYEVSIETPSNPGNPLHLNHESMFVQLDIYEDLFSNVLKGEYTFKDTQGWAEMIPLIGDETLVISYSTPGGEGTQVETQSQDPESQTASEEIVEQRFKVYDCIEVGTGERLKIYKLSLISPTNFHFLTEHIFFTYKRQLIYLCSFFCSNFYAIIYLKSLSGNFFTCSLGI